MKACCTCKEKKQASNFHKRSNGTVSSRCNKCRYSKDNDQRQKTRAAIAKGSKFIVCVKCKQKKSKSNFSVSRSGKIPVTCIDCRRDVSNKVLQLKIELLNAYGGCKCACKGCNITEVEFLTLDHIGDSKKKLNHKGINLYRVLRKEGYPHKNKLRVLCWNCNCALGQRGYCPHQLIK